MKHIICLVGSTFIWRSSQHPWLAVRSCDLEFDMGCPILLPAPSLRMHQIGLDMHVEVIWQLQYLQSKGRARQNWVDTDHDLRSSREEKTKNVFFAIGLHFLRKRALVAPRAPAPRVVWMNIRGIWARFSPRDGSQPMPFCEENGAQLQRKRLEGCCCNPHAMMSLSCLLSSCGMQ